MAEQLTMFSHITEEKSVSLEDALAFIQDFPILNNPMRISLDFIEKIKKLFSL